MKWRDWGYAEIDFFSAALDEKFRKNDFPIGVDLQNYSVEDLTRQYPMPAREHLEDGLAEQAEAANTKLETLHKDSC